MALTFASLLGFGFFARNLFLIYPPVWPDEALFSSPAVDLVRHRVFGTPVFSGLVPGADQHTFLQPPLYFLCLSGVLAVFGISVVSVRLASLAAGIAVMDLTYHVGLRSGLGRWFSLLGVALLAADTVFLRGALIGRMDMLALVFILLALALDLGPAESSGWLSGRTALLTGLACALATLTHPMGATAPTALVAGRTISPLGARKKILPPLLIGITAPLIAWLGYAVAHWRIFPAQFGSQILTKSTRRPLLPMSLYYTYRSFGFQYGPPSHFMPVVWLAGLVGLAVALRRRKRNLVLLLIQLVIFGVAFWGREMWYPLYFAPLTAVSLGHLVRLTSEKQVRVKAFGWMSLFLAAWFAQRSYSTTRTIYINWVNVDYVGETQYLPWCESISEAIPSGSTVMLSVVPDPYFCLVRRRDLTLREFPPKGFQVNPETYLRWLEQTDFVVTGGPHPSKEIWEYVRARVKLVKKVGVSSGTGYSAGVYQMPKEPRETRPHRSAPGAGS